MSACPVFFTGGTALRDTSRELARKNLKSVHLVTTFDSGGSSAALRKALAIPAVGDLRNRLLALADTERTPAEVLDFCGMRLPMTGDREQARAMLAKIYASHPAWQTLPEKFRILLKRNLQYFLKRMPENFDARGASLGNLMLAGSYLENRRDFGPALALFSALFHIRGKILPIVNASLHLGAKMANGAYIIGQHLFRNLPAPVERLFLTVHESMDIVPPGGVPVECQPPISPGVSACLEEAGIICYPMGSFYSSLLANLLPAGVGRAISASPAPKIFIPNSGDDPELRGLDIAGQARMILQRLREDCPFSRPDSLLNYFLVDSRHGKYPGSIREAANSLADMGIQVIDRPVVLADNPKKHSPEAVLAVLGELESQRCLS